MVKLLDLQAITAMHGDEYKAAVNRVIDSGWFLQGNENKQFEVDYAKYIGTEHCIAVANGLDALYLLMRDYRSSQHLYCHHHCYYPQQPCSRLG